MEIITPSLYRPIFYSLLTLLAIFVLPRYYFLDEKDLQDEHKFEDLLAVLLAIFLTFFFGNRPCDNFEFGDSHGMAFDYELRRAQLYSFTWDWDASNVIFDNIFDYFAFLGYTHSQFFTIIAAIYFFSVLWACKRFFPNYLLLSFLTCMFSFVTYGNVVNGFKAGAASAIFLLALSYNDKSKFITLVFILVAWGFHHAFHVCLVAFAAAFFLRSPKVNFVIWCLCVVIAALHITYFQELLSVYTDEGGARYLSVQSMREYGGGYYTGFRIDFLIFSAMPMLLGYFALGKRHIEDEGYKFLLNMYILANSVWVLCMYASFTNRIAALSWFMYPILILYPFLRCDWGNGKYKIMSLMCAAQISFTLFMAFIYKNI